MRVFTGFIILLLTACASSPPAPVIDRTPQRQPQPPAVKPPISNPVGKSVEADKDWRPDSHIVKKGETLFGIGLQYGIDYREIASANNIAPPYPVQIGQKLDLSSFKAAPAVESAVTEDGVVVTPMKTEPAVVADKPVIVNKPASEKPIASAVTPVLSEPKALREPYSLQAMNRAPSQTETTAIKPDVIKPGETNAAEVKPAESKPTGTTGTTATGDEAITWAWPTQGKVVTSFNEATNKGIDIAGETGQTIIAASAGKVIYSGSDLRGYGKLVIVKHNKTYLSVYAHNSKIVVKEGQNVVAGQKIAEMGNTDSSTTKLHFEIRRLGKSVDPTKYLN
jgi:lipoprotein NlpD